SNSIERNRIAECITSCRRLMFQAQRTLRVKTEKRLTSEASYRLLLDFLGEDFGSHGTSLNSAIHHIESGIPTGGQGGANFSVNSCAGAFGTGNNSCILVTSIKDVILQARKLNCAISIACRIGINKFRELRFDNDGLILKEDNEIVKARDLKAFFPEKRDLVLRIQKGASTKLKVPWIACTDDARVITSLKSRFNELTVFLSDYNEFNLDSAFAIANFLMQTARGRMLLKRQLKQ
ncbi:hypothetical protein ACFL1B_01355, partial [Nanoarchaeota archaeon]